MLVKTFRNCCRHYPVEGLVKGLSVFGVGVVALSRPHVLVDVLSVEVVSINEPLVISRNKQSFMND